MKLRLAVVAVLCLLMPVVSSTGPAPAIAHGDGIQVVSQSVQNRFPQGMQFNLFVNSGGDITDARLRYRLTPQTLETQFKATCTPGTAANCTAAIGATNAAYLVPGSTVEYSWELHDSAGNTLITDKAQTQYMDTRFQWDSKTDGKVTAYFHSGSDQSVNSILQAANESVSRMSGLLRTSIDFQIKVWVYDSAKELQAAAAPGSQATGGTLEGQVVAADTALVSRDQSTLDTVRHELAHVVVDRASRGFIVPIAIWVNEGLAVYSQKSFDAGWQQALDLAVRRNRPLPIESLGDSTRSNADFSLFYAESGSLIKYLVDTYGDAKFGDFFTGMRSDTVSGALKSVYGFDQLGLENAWRKSIGLPAVDASAGQSGSGGSSNVVPTTVPFGSGGGQSSAAVTPSKGDQGQTNPSSSGGSSNSLIVVVGVLTALAAAGLVGAGVYFARKA